MEIDPFLPQPRREHLDSVLGLQIKEAGPDRVVALLAVTPRLHQAFGIVHGGVYAMAVEGIASAGACAAVAERGQYAVGTSNATDFLRPVTVATVEVVAEPIFQGRTQQLWSVEIVRLDNGKLVAKGQLRLQNLPLPDADADAPTRP
jgi:1,4-dihydroxy-2-naphthoyl-CoA hydrolase